MVRNKNHVTSFYSEVVPLHEVMRFCGFLGPNGPLFTHVEADGIEICVVHQKEGLSHEGLHILLSFHLLFATCLSRGFGLSPLSGSLNPQLLGY